MKQNNGTMPQYIQHTQQYPILSPSTPMELTTTSYHLLAALSNEPLTRWWADRLFVATAAPWPLGPPLSS